MARWAIYVGSVVFIAVLAVSAVFDAKIRVLHTLQALPYIATIVLARRKSAWGYGIGAIMAAFWNYTNVFFTTFGRNGFEEAWHLVRTGKVHRPDQLVAFFAIIAHFVLIAGCLAAYFELRKRTWRDPLRFVAGGFFATAFFVAAIYTTGQQYIPLMKRVLLGN
jgi:hypothetical protein